MPDNGQASIPPPWRLPVPFRGISLFTPAITHDGGSKPERSVSGLWARRPALSADLRGGQLERNRVMANPDYTDLVAAQRAYFLTIQVAI